MRRWAGLLFSIVLALPVYAQRGAAQPAFSGHAGASTHIGSASRSSSMSYGDFTGRAVSPPHTNPRYSDLTGSQHWSSFSPPGLFPLPPQLPSPVRNGAYQPNSTMPFSHSGYPNRDPYHDPNRNHGDHHEHRHPYDHSHGYNYAYGYPGWYPYFGYPLVINPGFYDWSVPDDSGENQGAQTNAPYSETPGNVNPEPYPEDASNTVLPARENYPAPETPSRQSYVAAQAQASSVAEEPLTLIFKDGRTPEKIKNYIVSSTSLTDLDRGHYKQIPLAEIDIAATAKINRANGVFFRVPGES